MTCIKALQKQMPVDPTSVHAGVVRKAKKELHDADTTFAKTLRQCTTRMLPLCFIKKPDDLDEGEDKEDPPRWCLGDRRSTRCRSCVRDAS